MPQAPPEHGDGGGGKSVILLKPLGPNLRPLELSGRLPWLPPPPPPEKKLLDTGPDPPMLSFFLFCRSSIPTSVLKLNEINMSVSHKSVLYVMMMMMMRALKIVLRELRQTLNNLQ